jgi:hypothetical protein
MRRTIALFIIPLSVIISASGQKSVKPRSDAHSAAPASPLNSISFERGEPVAGVAASRAIALPFQCTSDGTVFVDMVLQSLPNSFPVDQLVSIPSSGEAHEYRLDQLTDLYHALRKGYYASESTVAFLVMLHRRTGKASKRTSLRTELSTKSRGASRTITTTS